MRDSVADFGRLLKYEITNMARSKWLIFYSLFFVGFTIAVLQFGRDPIKAAVSLSSIVLLVVPLVSILYASVYWYSVEPFTSLLLTQPLTRSTVYLARWSAMSVTLAVTFFASTLTTLALYGALNESTLLLLGLGVLLSVCFVAIGMVTAVLIQDRMKGIGATFMLWMYFAFLHDAIVFGLMTIFRDYPLETPAITLMIVNPIDLIRVSLLMGLDLAAMMGYTGRLLQSLLSGPQGMFLTSTGLLAWILIPLWVGLKSFKRKDL